jgi:hypothetical protein
MRASNVKALLTVLSLNVNNAPTPSESYIFRGFNAMIFEIF